MAKVADWATICAKLPTNKSPEETAARAALFKQFDPNSNGLLSLAEVDKSLRDVLGLDGIFDCKPVIIRAFNAAKSLNTKAGLPSKGDDYIEKSEFRMLLVYVACYFRIYEVFSQADQSGDKRLTKDEFAAMLPKLSQWTNDMNAEAVWASVNSDGGEFATFTEFAGWAIPKVMERDNPEAA